MVGLIGDAGETFDLTNIGTLFAFVLVCFGVIVAALHVIRIGPGRSGCRFVHGVGIVGAALLCVFVMKGLPSILRGFGSDGGW